MPGAGSGTIVRLNVADGRSVAAGERRATDDLAADGAGPPAAGCAPDLPPPVPARSEIPTIAVSAAAISESASHPDGP